MWKEEEEKIREAKRRRKEKGEKRKKETEKVDICWSVEELRFMTSENLRVQLLLHQDRQPQHSRKKILLGSKKQERLDDLIKLITPP